MFLLITLREDPGDKGISKHPVKIECIDQVPLVYPLFFSRVTLKNAAFFPYLFLALTRILNRFRD